MTALQALDILSGTLTWACARRLASAQAFTSRGFQPSEKVSYQNRAKAILRCRHSTENSEEPLIHDYAVLLGEAEVDQSIPVADRLLECHGAGSVASLSFDKGFTREADRQLLGLYIPEVIMPKRGKKNAAETGCESSTARWRARSTAWNTTD